MTQSLNRTLLANQLEVALLSDVGCSRSINEDSGLVHILEEGGLFAVADGMGGHNSGDVASQMTVELMKKYYSSYREAVPQRLVRTLEQVNHQVYAEAARPERRGMGTTVTAVAIEQNTAIIANIGDSRTYLFRAGQLELLTRDHSWVAEQLRLGILTEEETVNHRWRSVISNALGSAADLKLDLSGIRLQPEDILLLCSDGLGAVVTDERVIEILNADMGMAATAQILVEEANRGGGPDNITVLLIKVRALSSQTPAYPLPVWQGHHPVLAYELLGDTPRHEKDSIFNTLEEVVEPSKWTGRVVLILLWLIMITIFFVPVPYRVPAIWLLGGVVLALGIQYLRQRRQPTPPSSDENA